MDKIIVANIQITASPTPESSVRVNFKATSSAGVMVETFCEVPLNSTRFSMRLLMQTAARAALLAAGDSLASSKEMIVAGDS